MSALLRLLLNRPRQIVLVQNPDDRDGMLSLGIAAERIVLIPGSGVDVEALQPMPEPPGPPTVAFVGRLLADKGIHTLIRAHRLLRQRGSNVELLIAGTPDPANPGLGERTGGRGLEPRARRHLARPRRRHRGALGARAHRRAAVAARGPAEKPAGGRGLRPADDRDRRSRVPRGRAPRRNRPAGARTTMRPALADAIETLAASAELRAAIRRGGAPACRRAILRRRDRPADR